MTDPRPDKVAVVDEVREKFQNSNAVMLTEYRGLDVPAMAKLRSALREAGGEYKIYKNTLALRAVRELGLDIEEHFTGPTALAFVARAEDGSRGDPVGVAKALDDFAKENDALVIKGGLLDDTFLSGDDVKALAKVPPRDVLLARLAAGLASPLQRFAGLLQALPRDFSYALSALIEKGGGPDAAPDAPVVAEVVAADEPAVAEEPPAETAAPADEAPASDAAEEEAEAPAEDSAPDTEASAEGSTETEATADDSNEETETEKEEG